MLKSGTRVWVSLEATGIYSLDLALALDAAQGIEVADPYFRAFYKHYKPDTKPNFRP